MIIRIVKMNFMPEKVSEFLDIFSSTALHIRDFPGCEGVELYRSASDPSTLFTISRWRSEADLEAYRKSGLFSSTWSRTKPLFASKAEAWSLSGAF
ncbi:MAG: hypothetical protein RL213_101 [Bacteroidota bacterium]